MACFVRLLSTVSYRRVRKIVFNCLQLEAALALAHEAAEFRVRGMPGGIQYTEEPRRAHERAWRQIQEIQVNTNGFPPLFNFMCYDHNFDCSDTIYVFQVSARRLHKDVFLICQHGLACAQP